MILEQSTIVKHQKIAKDTYEMVCKSELSKELKAGQFINVKVAGMYLRRPISISSIQEDGYTIVYKVVGEGTKVLSEKSAGECLDVLGPLGNGFPTNEVGDILILGGGVGVPPLYEVAKSYREKGNNVTVILGFQDKESIFYEEEFKTLGCITYLCSENGSYGFHGNVLQQANQLNLGEVTVYACGPMGMLAAISSVYKKGYLSFEARMACGMGACMACVVQEKDKTVLSRRICKEGPIFRIGEVEL